MKKWQNERLAKSYIAAYDKTRVEKGSAVKDGATWDDWKFAENAEYWSPVDFECWPAVDGCAWKSHFGGHRRDNGEFILEK